MSAGILALLLEAIAFGLLGIRAWFPPQHLANWTTARAWLYPASLVALVGALVLSFAAVGGGA